MKPDEKELLIRLQNILAKLDASDRYTIQKKMQFFNGRNIQFGLTDGTKIGTSALEKIGFWNTTPVIQPSAIGNPSGGGSAGVDTPARTAIISILTALRNEGLIAI